jgi:hypothetical protein
MADEAELATAQTRVAKMAARQAAERRIELRAEIREIERRIAEAQQNRSFWDKLVDAFTYIGAALAAVAGVAVSVATMGGATAAAVAGVVATVSGIAGAGAGALAGGSQFAATLEEAEALELSADRMGVEDRIATGDETAAQVRAFAEAVAQSEDVMRRQALSWIRNEDEARRTAASA